MAEDDRFLSLLAAAMEHQTWDPPGAVPAPARYAQALSGAMPLTAAERRQLLLSPTARLHYQIARDAAAGRMRVRFADQGYQTSGLALAASDPGARHARIQTDDFSLSVERDDSDPEGPEWMLVVELGARLRTELLGSGLSLALRDDGGLTWLVDRPDEGGVLAGIWAHDGSPVERLARHVVRLDIL